MPTKIIMRPYDSILYERRHSFKTTPIMIIQLSKASMRYLQDACLAFREQHSIDLVVYKSSHKEWKNRWLHSCLIPIESFSAFLFVTAVCLQTLPLSKLQLNLLLIVLVGFPMGMLSLVISHTDHPYAGTAAFVILVACPWISCSVVKPEQVDMEDCDYFTGAMDRGVVLTGIGGALSLGR